MAQCVDLQQQADLEALVLAQMDQAIEDRLPIAVTGEIVIGDEEFCDALLGVGAASGMDCASQASASGDMGAMSAPGASVAGAAATVSAPADGQRGLDCGGLQLCQASSPSVASQGVVPAAIPQVAATSVTQPKSVVRTPLLPPPERTTA